MYWRRRHTVSFRRNTRGRRSRSGDPSVLSRPTVQLSPCEVTTLDEDPTRVGLTPTAHRPRPPEERPKEHCSTAASDRGLKGPLGCSKLRRKQPLFPTEGPFVGPYVNRRLQRWSNDVSVVAESIQGSEY